MSTELDELRQVVRRFLADKSGSEAVRKLLGTAGDPQVWSQLSEQLGLTGLVVPEEHGGAGMGSVELAVVMEELGRALYVGPYFSSVAFAVQALVASGDPEVCEQWLPRLAEGAVTGTIAGLERGGSALQLTDVSTYAMEDAAARGGWRLHGTKVHVVDGATSGVLVVLATIGDETGMFVVDATEGEPEGLTRTEQPNLDLTRPLATVELDGVPAVRVGGDALEAWATTADLARVALAAEQVGGASRVLEMAVEYAKERVQFDRPIGSFQAIKHKCADMFVEVESARSAVSYAALALADGDADASVAASVALAWSSDTYVHAAKENIQIHGGIGFTWEHDAHLFLRRAKVTSMLLGSPAEHRARIADLVGV